MRARRVEPIRRCTCRGVPYRAGVEHIPRIRHVKCRNTYSSVEDSSAPSQTALYGPTTAWAERRYFRAFVQRVVPLGRKKKKKKGARQTTLLHPAARAQRRHQPPTSTPLRAHQGSTYCCRKAAVNFAPPCRTATQQRTKPANLAAPCRTKQNHTSAR